MKIYGIIYGGKKGPGFSFYFIILKIVNTLIGELITAFTFKTLYFKYSDIMFLKIKQKIFIGMVI